MEASDLPAERFGESAPTPRFPYATWGVQMAIGGVLIALGARDRASGSRR